MSYAGLPGSTKKRNDPMADATRLALEEIYGASLAWAVACCRYDPVEAEDVLQMSYQKVLEGKARFEGRSSVKSWFFAVIRRTAAERHRRVRIFSRLLELWRAPEPPPTPPGPEETLLEGERRHQVRALLASLPARQREVLELTFYQELSVEEAAGVMGLSAGAARVHYHRAKRRCAALLGESDTPAVPAESTR